MRILHEKQWTLVDGFWGLWFLLEVIGSVLVPCFMFAYGVRHRLLGVIRTAAVMSLVGILLNRLNISVIAFNWNAATRYYPSWMEVVVTLMVVFAEIWAFRWIVNRVPVLQPSSPNAAATA